MSGGKRKQIAPVWFFIFLLCKQALAADTNRTVWITDRKILDCAPKTLRSGQILALKLGKNHGSELAIRRVADKTWYFLVVQSPPKDMHSLMTPDGFAAASHVSLPTDIVGYRWETGYSSERIFTKPGRYTVYSSEALESEEGGHICSIRYDG